MLWRRPFRFLLLFGALGTSISAQTPPPAQLPPPPPAQLPPPPTGSQLTAEQDRDRLLTLLHIQSIRPPASSDARAPDAANYDEAKANVYPNLPDPLRLLNGSRVTTPRQWWNQRRPEIVALYDREVLGRTPPNLPAVSWQVVSVVHEVYEGIPVITKRLSGRVDNAADPAIDVTIDAILTTPANAPGPVPVIVELAFANDFMRAISRPGQDDPRLKGNYGVQWQPVLARGWGFAVLNPASIQADDGAGLTRGIIGLMNHGQPRSPDDWGALKAWAWGAGRLLDYFQTDPAVNARQVALAGHSRFGKAALVTMACDPRFAIAYVSSSGEGGAKLYRHIFGEPIPNIASPTEYHWMAGNFLKYAGPLNAGDLPVDNHELIALCAPRPVFIGGGASVGDGYADPRGDAWADARGMFLAEVAAGPVYRLLGARDLGVSAFPPIETTLASGDLAFRQHNGGHTPAPNWPAFLEFAARYLHAPSHPQVMARN